MKGLKGWHNGLMTDFVSTGRSIKQKELKSGQSSWLMHSRPQCFKAGSRVLLTEALCPHDRDRLLMSLNSSAPFCLVGIFYPTHPTSSWFERTLHQLSARSELAGGKLNNWGNCPGRVYLWNEKRDRGSTDSPNLQEDSIPVLPLVRATNSWPPSLAGQTPFLQSRHTEVNSWQQLIFSISSKTYVRGVNSTLTASPRVTYLLSWGHWDSPDTVGIWGIATWKARSWEIPCAVLQSFSTSWERRGRQKNQPQEVTL